LELPQPQGLPNISRPWGAIVSLRARAELAAKLSQRAAFRHAVIVIPIELRGYTKIFAAVPPAKLLLAVPPATSTGAYGAYARPWR
jgi:hypothetical protein